MRIVIIGLGGIGGLLVNLVWKLCDNPQNELILIDGDEFELGNMPRQYFKKIGNKAECWTKMIADFCPTCKLVSVPKFYPDFKIEERDAVLIGVDNHYVRRLINEDCKRLRNITVISGGNELIDGNAQFFVIKDGIKVAGDFLDTYHPEIAKAELEKKKEEGCDRRPEPQFLVTNNLVVSAMVNILWAILNGNLPKYSEVYVDAEKNQMMPIFRQGR